MKESALTFGGSADLAGVLCEPERLRTGSAPVFVFLNAGLLHHVGPHRLHVEAARALAGRGFASLRFDLSNTGDSGPRQDRLPFEESAVLEAKEAIDCLATRFPGRPVLLFGLCSGAMVAVKTAAIDARCQALVLINTQSHTTDQRLKRYVSHKKESHYFWKVSLFNPASWARVFTGRTRYRENLKMLFRQAGSIFRRKPAFAAGAWDMVSDFRKLADRDVPILHFFSLGDPAFEVYRAVVGFGLDQDRGRESVRVEVMSGVDHTFTPAWSRAELIERLVHWAESTLTTRLDGHRALGPDGASAS